MASNYPTSLDNFTNPTSNDSLNSPSHSLQHANINDAVEAIEAKLGIGASPAGSATEGYVLTAGTGGTTTWSAPSIAGLTLVKSQTIGTAVSSVTVTDAFSSTYENYLITVTGGSASTGTQLNVSFGSTNTGYYSGAVYVTYTGTAVNGLNVNNGSSFTYIGYMVADSLIVNMYVFAPNLAKNTSIAYSHGQMNNGGNYVSGAGFINNTTQYTSFTITPASGTMTGGTVRVYGLRNS